MMENKEKLCPFLFSSAIGGCCIKDACSFWCDFADECTSPLLAGMFADSTIRQNVFEEESR
ncbi:MAG: hypothetical protein KH509_06500 [Clostridium sp.]|jgi:hypothetical protein|nr:hypothetical protein [Clostridium sp.]